MKTEKIITGIAILFFILKINQVPGTELGLICAMSALSIIFCYGGFYFFSGKTFNEQKLALSIPAGIILSLCVIGILFSTEQYPGADMMLLLSMIFAPALLIATFIIKANSKVPMKTYFIHMIIRTAFWTLATYLFYFLPL
jgi:hypothetical protein